MSIIWFLTDEGRESVPFLQLHFRYFDHEDIIEKVRNFKLI